jgi:hypothetical protein
MSKLEESPHAQRGSVKLAVHAKKTTCVRGYVSLRVYCEVTDRSPHVCAVSLRTGHGGSRRLPLGASLYHQLPLQILIVNLLGSCG